jgi:protease I
MSLSDKKILMILPHNKFQDEEYLELSAILSNSFARIDVVSSRKPAKGMHGIVVAPDHLIEEVEVKEFDAVLLVGGVGSIEYWHSNQVMGLLKKANNHDKLICAICLAPVTLANAGLLKNKKATAYNKAATYLSSRGAIYTGKPVEISGNIITASGPESAREFAEAIADSLTNRAHRSTESEIEDN